MRGWRNYIAFVVAGLKLVIMSGAKSLATCFSCYPSCNFSRGMMAIQNSHRATLVTSTNQLLSLPHEILLGWFYFTSLAAQNRMSPYNTDKAHKISQISVALFAIPPSSGWSITALVTWLLEFVISLLRLFVPCCSARYPLRGRALRDIASSEISFTRKSAKIFCAWCHEEIARLRTWSRVTMPPSIADFVTFPSRSLSQ